MAQTITDRRDVQFVLYEQFNIETLSKSPKFKGLNKKTYEMVLSEARSLATKEMLAISPEGDQEGCQFENGKVKMPESFHRAYNLVREGEWIAVADDPEVGGQGMPQIIATSVMEMFQGANVSLALFFVLGHGAGKLIELFGTKKQKELYLEKVYSGEWGGTMALTESGAGSDVGALITSAKKNSDGTYSITGNKIFNSCAEHDFTENIINPVLARIEGAPAGTKGISLFVVPKIWVNDDGSLGEPNDVVCTGIEEKIGIHSSPTCSMTLGGKGNCRGTLLGEENKGLNAMFHMMNEARLAVAIQALGGASASFLYAVNYARERLQGKHLTQSRNPDASPVAIIEHPDVRRMLLWMKAQVEGNRSLNYYVAMCMDKAEIAENDEEKERLNDRISILTPICKAYTSEKSCEVCTMGIQVYGGYGACREYPMEQLLRDCRISTIYEGTTGIQSMDLLSRKIGMKKGKPFKELLEEMQSTVAEAKNKPGLEDIAVQMEGTVTRLLETALHLMQKMPSNISAAFAQSYPFLEVCGDVVIGWMLLWRASVASSALSKLLGDKDEEKRKELLKKNKDAAFYDGQIQTARYFINSMLPETVGKMSAIKNMEAAPVEITEAGFGG